MENLITIEAPETDKPTYGVNKPYAVIYYNTPGVHGIYNTPGLIQFYTLDELKTRLGRRAMIADDIERARKFMKDFGDDPESDGEFIKKMKVLIASDTDSLHREIRILSELEVLEPGESKNIPEFSVVIVHFKHD